MLKKLVTLTAVTLSVSCSQIPAAKKVVPEAITSPIWVYQSTGARQCEPGSGISQEASAAILRHYGITVTRSKIGLLDGIAVITLCGAPTLNIYLHEIDSSQFNTAGNHDFRLVSELNNENYLGYSLTK